MIEFNATFIVAMLSFALFILIMNTIFYNPVLNMMKKREDYINSNYEDSKRFEASAQEYNTEHASKIEQVQDKCRHEFRAEIEQVKAKTGAKIDEARAQAKLQAQGKKEELTQQGNELKTTVKNTVVRDLASIITSKFPGVDTSISEADFSTIDKVMN